MTTTSLNEVFVPIDEQSSSLLNLIQEQDNIRRFLKGESTDKTQIKEDKAIFNSSLDTRKTTVSDEFWDRFLLLSKVCYMRDKDADLYDVFDTMRTRVLGGWEYSASYLQQVDNQIEKEERRGHKRTL